MYLNKLATLMLDFFANVLYQKYILGVKTVKNHLNLFDVKQVLNYHQSEKIYYSLKFVSFADNLAQCLLE